MSQQEYLTVADALAMVLGAVSQLPAEMVPLGQALGRVLAAPAVARDNLPPFANSAMDGFAVRAADVSDASRGNPARLRVVADVAAGHVPDVVVGEGCAARIMTGAPLPAGADAVIPVEDTDEAWRDEARPLPEQVQLFRSVGVGDYVRQAGEDIRVGAEIIPAGKQLRPQEIGVLASIGQAEVLVVRQPRVGILATGDELIDVDQPLQPGKIRNSNGYAQEAQVRAAGAIPVPLGIARDTLVDVRDRLQAGLDAGVDLFVSSAGVSVGAYDVVKAVLDASGDVRFWRVRMRPGKPLAFGTYGGVTYFGLPGNPVSAMVSFERFVRPVLRKMSGLQALFRPEVQATLLESISSDGRESYLRAIVSQPEPGVYEAVTTGDQGSHIMTSLVQANALLIVPEGVTAVPAGTRLAAMMIDSDS